MKNLDKSQYTWENTGISWFLIKILENRYETWEKAVFASCLGLE